MLPNITFVVAAGWAVIVITGAGTVTLQAAVLPPSSVLTVIVAVPAARAVTVPFHDTVATDMLLLLHVRF